MKASSLKSEVGCWMLDVWIQGRSISFDNSPQVSGWQLVLGHLIALPPFPSPPREGPPTHLCLTRFLAQKCLAQKQNIFKAQVYFGQLDKVNQIKFYLCASFIRVLSTELMNLCLVEQKSMKTTTKTRN